MISNDDVAAVQISPPDVVDSYTGAVAAALASRRVAIHDAYAHLALRSATLATAADRLLRALRGGHKALVAGNGGSAAEAQHFAAELVGRFKRERAPYAALALTTDSSILTAIANDYGYAEVFARQVLGLGRPGDVLITYSTSGESENLIRAAKAAHSQQMAVIAITGERRNRLERLADVAVRIPLADTAVVQELQMAVTHILCTIAEAELAQTAAEGAVH